MSLRVGIIVLSMLALLVPASGQQPQPSNDNSDVPLGGWFPKRTKRSVKSQRKKAAVPDWQLLGTSGEAGEARSLYYHPASVTRVDDEMVKVWTRQVSIPQPAQKKQAVTEPYSLDLFAIRCDAGQFALLKTAYFDEKNNLTDVDKFPEEWNSITRFTFLDTLRKKVCA